MKSVSMAGTALWRRCRLPPDSRWKWYLTIMYRTGNLQRVVQSHREDGHSLRTEVLEERGVPVEIPAGIILRADRVKL